MLIPGIDIPFNDINLCQKPVNARAAAKKLTEIIVTELGRPPEVNELFLFFTAKRDQLKLFWRDRTGSQEISRALPQGGFILPAPKQGKAFVKIERTMLEKLFRARPSPGTGEGGTAKRGVRDRASETQLNSDQDALADAGFVEINLHQLRGIIEPRPKQKPTPRKTKIKPVVVPIRPKLKPTKKK